MLIPWKRCCWRLRSVANLGSQVDAGSRLQPLWPRSFQCVGLRWCLVGSFASWRGHHGFYSDSINVRIKPACVFVLTGTHDVFVVLGQLSKIWDERISRAAVWPLGARFVQRWGHLENFESLDGCLWALWGHFNFETFPSSGSNSLQERFSSSFWRSLKLNSSRFCVTCFDVFRIK